MELTGILISVFTAFCWTITVISFEYAGKRVGSLPVNFIRLIIGSSLLGITLLFTSGSFIPLGISLNAWTLLMISGFIGLVIGDLFLFQAFVDIGGRISLLIMSTVPIMSAILGYFFLEESLSGKSIIGIVIILVAVMSAILAKNNKKEEKHPHLKKGIIFAIIGAVAQSIGLLFSKNGMGDMGAFEATQIRLFAAIIGFTIYIFAKKDWTNVYQALNKRKAMLFISLGSVFGPFLGVSSSLLALKYIEMGVATTVAQLNVIMIIPFSIFLFKEKVNLIEILASLIAIIGVGILIL